MSLRLRPDHRGECSEKCSDLDLLTCIHVRNAHVEIRFSRLFICLVVCVSAADSPSLSIHLLPVGLGQEEAVVGLGAAPGLEPGCGYVAHVVQRPEPGLHAVERRATQRRLGHEHDVDGLWPELVHEDLHRLQTKRVDES